MIDDILKYARMNKELAKVDEDAMDASSELKKLVQAQAAELELLKQRVCFRKERERGQRGKRTQTRPRTEGREREPRRQYWGSCG